MNYSDNLDQRLRLLKKKLDLEGLKKKIDQIGLQSGESSFWQDQEKAALAMKEMAGYQKEISQVEEIEELVLKGEDHQAEKTLEKLEIKIFLSGRYDSSPAILSIHSGQGGVEAMDWAQMLQRMYVRFFEKKGWSYTVFSENFGEEAGIKNVSLGVQEPFAFGFLKFEAGTHRLVRQSPFNADQLRQTSFALVEVLPQIEDKEEEEIPETDLEWQFFRSSSQGGQNVQKVSTAVRLIHEPTKTVVTCQSERFQEQNRKIALRLLKAKLWQKEEEKRRAEIKNLKGGKTKAAWGTQIRSYVLHPYKMVKDLRTKIETQDAEKVLSGELDIFIEEEIRQLSASN